MKNENDNEIKPTLETSLCALLLESSRRYSALADVVFGFSVEQSNFANKISGQRMTLAKVVVQTQMDFAITMEGGALEIFQCSGQMDVILELWEDCQSLDKLIQELLKAADDSWGPIIQELKNTIQKSEQFSKEITEGRGEADGWQCLNCGAIIQQQSNSCPICNSKHNWISFITKGV